MVVVVVGAVDAAVAVVVVVVWNCEFFGSREGGGFKCKGFFMLDMKLVFVFSVALAAALVLPALRVNEVILSSLNFLISLRLFSMCFEVPYMF